MPGPERHRGKQNAYSALSEHSGKVTKPHTELTKAGNQQRHSESITGWNGVVSLGGPACPHWPPGLNTDPGHTHPRHIHMLLLRAKGVLKWAGSSSRDHSAGARLPGLDPNFPTYCDFEHVTISLSRLCKMGIIRALPLQVLRTQGSKQSP